MKTIKFLFLAVTAMIFANCNDKYPDLGDGVFAEIITNKGTAVAKLNYKETPMTVGNFVALAEGTHTEVDSVYKGKKFYNGLTFHRVVKEFVIQGGDPEGTGMGGPGYKFADEIVDSLKHSKKGILSMANSGPATNGSQFFITLKETPWLNGRHTVFGEVVKGQEVVDSIGVTETAAQGKPKDTIVIKEMNIIRQGSDAKSFDGAKAFKDGLEKAEAEKIEKEKLAKAKKEEQERLTKIAAEKKKAVFEGLKASTTKFLSGLLFKLTEKGTGASPKDGDQIKMNYAGYFTDGRLFDSNKAEIEKEYGKYDENFAQRGKYQAIPVPYSKDAQLIPGFKEGLLALKNVGDKAFIYIPSHLGYGERGAGQTIPPNTDLIFELELVDVLKAPAKK